MQDPRVQHICDQIKLLDGQDPEELARLKRQLPIITPHACRFTGDGSRKSANAVPSGLVMLDIDHIDDPRDIFSCNIFPKLQNTSPSRGRELIAAEVVENKVVEVVDLNNPRIHFVAITPSGHGLRIIAERQENESLIAAQTRLANLCGFAEYDAVTHDLARASYLMPWSYVLYCEPSGLNFRDEAHALEVQHACQVPADPLPLEGVDCRGSC